MPRAKGARRALLIAEERQQKARWFYLSFAIGYEFLGAAMIQGHGFLTAIQCASDLNINPGGGVSRQLASRASSFVARRDCRGGSFLLLADLLNP